MWKKSKSLFHSLLLRNHRSYQAKTKQFKEKELLIREIFATDMKNLLDIERVVYEGDLPWTRSTFLYELYSKKPHLYLGVFDERKMVAFIGLRVDKKDGHVTNFAVLPNYQNLGIGTFLLNEVQHFAQIKFCEQLSLEVRVTNLDAQRLYRRFGFVSQKILENYYDKYQEDALEMVKNLHDY